MFIYLASHEQSGHQLFSHSDDARRWVKYQAESHQQTPGKWVTFPDSESLRLADGRTYAGTVRCLEVDQRAEHRQYEAEQQADALESAEAEADRAASRLRSAAQRALESLENLIADTTDPGVEALGARYELATALSAP